MASIFSRRDMAIDDCVRVNSRKLRCKLQITREIHEIAVVDRASSDTSSGRHVEAAIRREGHRGGPQDVGNLHGAAGRLAGFTGIVETVNSSFGEFVAL